MSRFEVPEAPDLDIGLPAIGTRETQTSIRVGDGETAVIGGLIDKHSGMSSLLFVTAKIID